MVQRLYREPSYRCVWKFVQESRLQGGVHAWRLSPGVEETAECVKTYLKRPEKETGEEFFEKLKKMGVIQCVFGMSTRRFYLVKSTSTGDYAYLDFFGATNMVSNTLSISFTDRPQAGTISPLKPIVEYLD